MKNMTICDQIKRKFIRLSKGQRKVAQFVVDNPNVVATQIASEVGRLADVSESTVIRFCYALDLSGFSELQDKMRSYLVDRGELTAVKKATPAKKINNHLGKGIVKQDIAKISEIFNGLNEAYVKEAVHLVHNAKRVHFLGFRQSAPAAFWLYNNLITLRDQVYFVQCEADKIAQQLAFMDEESLMFVVSLDGEYEDISTIIDIAKRKNVKVIAIREDNATVNNEQADIVLTVPCTQKGDVTGSIAIFTLLHVLIESVIDENRQAYEAYRNNNVDKLKQSNFIAIG